MHVDNNFQHPYRKEKEMDRSKPAKRIGRPTKPPVEGERVPLGLRVTAAAKRKLEEAAIKSGRSISQEAELRIERSFDDDRLASVEEQLKGWKLNQWTEQFDKLNQWMEQVFGSDSLPNQSPWSKLSDEQLRQFLSLWSKLSYEQRRQILTKRSNLPRKKLDAEAAQRMKRMLERLDKETEARYGPSKGNKS
jgi:hypothetical protein